MSILEETINRLIVVIEEHKRMLESMTNERDEWREACNLERGATLRQMSINEELREKMAEMTAECDKLKEAVNTKGEE